MVGTTRHEIQVINRCFFVSIPRCFDWKIRPAQFLFLEAVFQFQYGSIGRVKLFFKCAPGCWFQFHYGSIGRPSFDAKSLCNLSFNSSMVRLEDANFPALLINDSSFNSSMVRLEAENKVNLKNITSMFQFQYGSIGSSACR